MDRDDLIVVRRFLNEIDAELARSALESAHVDAVISSDDAEGLDPALALSGVRLLVRAEDVDRAAEILRVHAPR